MCFWNKLICKNHEKYLNHRNAEKSIKNYKSRGKMLENESKKQKKENAFGIR